MNLLIPTVPFLGHRAVEIPDDRSAATLNVGRRKPLGAAVAAVPIKVPDVSGIAAYLHADARDANIEILSGGGTYQRQRSC
jgi:hypothetical protein